MNDTHGQKGEGWIGFDLDGTLAKYDGWKGIDHIGEPVRPMVELIRRMHDEGKVVKIMTARVSPRENPEIAKTRYPLYAGDGVGDVPEYAARWMLEMRKAGHVNDQAEACGFYSKKEWTARDFIADWCLENLGFLPEIVYQKDHLMIDLYDDRVKQVVPNEGVLVEDIAMSKRLRVKEVHIVHDTHTIDIRWVSRILLFLAGLCFGASLVFCLEGWLTASSIGEKEKKLHDAVYEYMGELAHERAHGYVDRVLGPVAP